MGGNWEYSAPGVRRWIRNGWDVFAREVQVEHDGLIGVSCSGPIRMMEGWIQSIFWGGEQRTMN